jgi:hypothetical protein
MKKNLLALLGIIAVAISSIALFDSFLPSLASAAAQPGIMATVATSSNPTISTTGVTLFATSTCAARIITTYASPIMLTFSDYAGQTPTATFGHLQTASTTVVYDASIYGCGLFKAYGFTSSAITVTETR